MRVVCCLRFVICWLLIVVVCCLLLFVNWWLCSLLCVVVRCEMSAVRCALSVVACLLLDACKWLPVVCCVLCVVLVRRLLFVVCCRC